MAVFAMINQQQRVDNVIVSDRDNAQRLVKLGLWADCEELTDSKSGGMGCKFDADKRTFSPA
ncbi:hypothetical protein [Chitinivorax sp. B]|uniref:hypothetical protein n=1 Tax=Chitinivorax sp. B TaxID=2502235 RepID=UPI0010F674CB|nr:hypothetical protein [Chitinivorax sp. B]